MALALGMTVAQVQNTISSRELDLWGRYRKKYGPLNPVRKYDAGAALIASQINNAHGGKARPLDFMPYGRDKVDYDGDTVVDTDQFIEMLKMTGRAEVAR